MYEYKRIRRLKTGAVVAIIVSIVLSSILIVISIKNHVIVKPIMSSSIVDQPDSSSFLYSSSRSSSLTVSISTADLNLLILVNKDHSLSDSYNFELTSIPRKYFISGDDYHFNTIAEPYLVAMLDAAKDDGVKLGIVSAYRTKSYQQGLFQSDVNSFVKSGFSESAAESKAALTVAPAGYSEHETGLAVDLGYNGKSYLNGSEYENTPAFAWLSAHCADYGFILRYPKDKESITQYDYEPWHYRYVGVDSAKKIKASGLCLEEYLKSLGINTR